MWYDPSPSQPERARLQGSAAPLHTQAHGGGRRQGRGFASEALLVCLNNFCPADQGEAGSDDPWAGGHRIDAAAVGGKIGKSCAILHGFLMKGDQVTNHF